MTAVPLTHPPHEPDLLDFLDALACDPLPARQTDREHIEAAIDAAVEQHDGLVTIAWAREHITREVAPHMVGAVMSATVRSRRYVWTGEYAENGGPSRNSSKPARIWRARLTEAS